MLCFRCDQDAVQECPRCGALYCDDHGDALCERCMDPAFALPSYRVYRGSLLALLVGSVVAVWLLILPPAGADQDSPPGAISGFAPTATPEATGEPTPAATSTSDDPVEGEPDATPTPEPTATPTSTPTPEPTPETTTYVVQPGDTLYGIAQQVGGGAPEAIEALADRIAAANGITDPLSIQAGQELVIPQ